MAQAMEESLFLMQPLQFVALAQEADQVAQQVARQMAHAYSCQHREELPLLA